VACSSSRRLTSKRNRSQRAWCPRALAWSRPAPTAPRCGSGGPGPAGYQVSATTSPSRVTATARAGS
jgi:hypothetical protein